LRQPLLQRLREREVDARVRVSEPEIDQFLREQPQGADPART
jgi:peptidyl-prolyl cis-trans isomerase SurA